MASPTSTVTGNRSQRPPADEDLASSPVVVVQLEGRDFPGAKAQACNEGQHGQVTPSDDGAGLAARQQRRYLLGGQRPGQRGSPPTGHGDSAETRHPSARPCESKNRRNDRRQVTTSLADPTDSPRPSRITKADRRPHTDGPDRSVAIRHIPQASPAKVGTQLRKAEKSSR